MTNASKHRKDSLQQGELLGNSRVCFVNGLVMVQEGSFVSHVHLVYYCKGKIENNLLCAFHLILCQPYVLSKKFKQTCDQII